MQQGYDPTPANKVSSRAVANDSPSAGIALPAVTPFQRRKDKVSKQEEAHSQNDQLTAQPIAGTPIIQRVLEDKEIEEHLAIIDSGKFDIGWFLNWQRQIAVVKPTYRTMGPEFEFAKLNAEGVPIHVDLARSTETINGLPFVIETDAGNVIELACPPFVLGTNMNDWEKAKSRSMLVAHVFEQTLKQMAERGAGSGGNLGWLLENVAGLFSTTLQYTEVKASYNDTPLTTFSKGVAAFTNEFFDKNAMTNSQINLKMTTNEVGMALRKGTKGSSPNIIIKNILTAQLFEGLKAFIEEGNVEQYRNRVAIISYYLSQIPTMALQFIMNDVRSQHMEQHPETREQNRDTFKAIPANQKLLIRLSSIKDYMGFWIKASLNDMMKDDPVIKGMVLAIKPETLAGFMLDRSGKTWEAHKEGLEAYSNTDLSEAYKNALSIIINNLVALASTKDIPTPQKMKIPRYKDEGGTKDLVNYAAGAPFMARPDTYVPLEGGHLVEARGLNKKIYDNQFMRGFQMPYYRASQGQLANEETPDYYKIASDKKKNTLADWPEQIANQVLIKAINSHDDLNVAAQQLVDVIKEAITMDERLKQYTYVLISKSVGAYAKSKGLQKEVIALFSPLVTKLFQGQAK
ncbi:hypothetical protein CLV51_103297 [Chitinophaga niastensis]|uniref:Uncharacterized protein n=1 Tax=Chitinophaga niastensis TaxID=536980 RepID=A0A2P8HJC2_CHINA|nr:hypothetical protein [Chitinophaga niastensis]PSL46319.1 hypothetical protein CLV51_103297 [Chitinophaga niastensis]